MISLVDATVQLTDTYSLLTEFDTRLLRDLFNISDTDNVDEIKVQRLLSHIYIASQ